MPQPLAKLLSINVSAFGGWLDYLFQRIMESSEVEFVIAFPGKTFYHEKTDLISYYSFKEDSNTGFQPIIENESPDVIHIWGTEFIHSYNALKAANQAGLNDRCIISIQGLVSIYGKYHYTEGLPNRVINNYMPRDLFRPSSVIQGKKDYLKKGQYEIKSIQLVPYVIGRTDWDRAISYLMNPKLKYYHCNECLRDSFYHQKWEIDSIERHSIFVSQSDYPIKGFHYMLDALNYIVRYYPDVVLYTTGKDLLHLSVIDQLKITTYQRYIIQLIKKYGLEEHVRFLGTLSESDMCARYCKSHVFVTPSTIENSPNSLGEAMMLGCPVVSADVGGVKNMMEHGKEGFVYQSSAPYMCAYYVMLLFESNELAVSFSRAEREHAKKIFDRDTNYNELIGIYNDIIINSQDK